MIQITQAQSTRTHGDYVPRDGPAFDGQCNRIGAQLGLPPVGVKGRGGLPDCAHWPMCVRPDSHYPGLYRKPTRNRSGRKVLPGREDFEGGASSRGFAVIRAWLRELDAPILRLLRDEIDRLLAEN